MDARTPADWLDLHAGGTPHAAALLFSDGVVTYRDLAVQVHRRSLDLRAQVGVGEVVPVRVRLDLPSIVELLAHANVGAVPLPHADDLPQRPEGRREGSIVAIRTSGTSGTRRIVPLTMANVSASVADSRRRLGTTAQDRWLLCLPLDHVGGLSVLLRMLEVGGCVIVERFGNGLVDVIARNRPTVASFVPTMVHRLLERSPEGLGSIATVLVGGGSITSATATKAAECGIDLVATYGMTETTSQVATMARGERLSHPGYVGKPLDSFDLAIEPDPSQVEATGRILVEGPAVFGGYLGKPTRSEPFRTSDIGWFDRDGGLTVVGRADDVVISGGDNVSLEGVGTSLRGIPGVLDAEVVAVDDPEWGAIICALVVADVSIDAVKEAARSRLERFELPRRWDIADAIPLLPNGKPDLPSIRTGFSNR
jgi:o-succinylbenzoate---CoA ligase